MRFGEFLHENNLISEEQLLVALADCWSNGGKIGNAICRLGFLSYEQVERWAKIFHGLEVIDLGAGIGNEQAGTLTYHSSGAQARP